MSYGCRRDLTSLKRSSMVLRECDDRLNGTASTDDMALGASVHPFTQPYEKSSSDRRLCLQFRFGLRIEFLLLLSVLFGEAPSDLVKFVLVATTCADFTKPQSVPNY